MIEQIELMLGQFFRRDAASAQRTEASVDTINATALRRQRLN
jgi:hypothetical protein